MAILRNVNASCKVIESVVQLLTMPLILPISATEELNEIKNVNNTHVISRCTSTLLHFHCYHFRFTYKLNYYRISFLLRS